MCSSRFPRKHQKKRACRASLLEESGNCYLNSFCALFRFDEGKSPDPVFLGYLLRSAPARETSIAWGTRRNALQHLPGDIPQPAYSDSIGSRAAEDRRLSRPAGRPDRGGGPEARLPAAGKAGLAATALSQSGDGMKNHRRHCFRTARRRCRRSVALRFQLSGENATFGCV